ncbi:MAG: c-type cytochrome [Anaerolineae bacterium]
MNRLVIESIEGRIITGITMFVAIMVLIGWVVINEPARMAAFERQHLGRSIERGGELFAANCATCHGPMGLGIAERAPALNSPQLFGFDFFNGVNGQIGRLQRQQVELNARITTLNSQRDALLAEVANATDDRRAAIIQEVNAIDADIAALTDQIASIDERLAPLLEERERILIAMEPAIDRGYLAGLEQAIATAEADNNPLHLTDFLDRSANRLLQAPWGSDVNSFIRTTLYHGRPGTGDAWNGSLMVAWAQVAGGPLRNDQIDDLVNFIVNWDRGNNWTLEDLYAVQQFPKLKADAAMVVAGPAVQTIGAESGNNLDVATELVMALTGDPDRGRGLYEGTVRSASNNRLACSSCHMGGAQAPATNEKWNNFLNVRLQLPDFAGWSPEKYFIHGVIYPNEYVVPGYASGVMPGNYISQLSAQDLADMIAYVKSYAE